MDFAHAIQHGRAGSYWHLGAVAPMSGPYNVRTAEVPALLHNALNPESEVLYISFWTVAMNRLHHFYDNPAEVFQQPYASIVEGLYNGDHVTLIDVGNVDHNTSAELATPQVLTFFITNQS